MDNMNSEEILIASYCVRVCVKLNRVEEKKLRPFRQESMSFPLRVCIDSNIYA